MNMRQMMIAVGLAAAMSLFASAPALAQQCSGYPVGPDISGAPSCGCGAGEMHLGYVGNNGSEPYCANTLSCKAGQIVTVTSSGNKQCVSSTAVPAGGACAPGQAIIAVPTSFAYWVLACTQGPACPPGWVMSGEHPGVCFLQCGPNTPQDYLAACSCPVGQKETQTYYNSMVETSSCVSICASGQDYVPGANICAPSCAADHMHNPATGACIPRCTGYFVWSTEYGVCMDTVQNHACTPPATKFKNFCVQCAVNGQTYDTALQKCTSSTGNGNGSLGNNGGGSIGNSGNGTLSNSGSSEGSGAQYQPSGPVSTTHTCQTGETWNGLHCMKPSQPSEGSGSQYQPSGPVSTTHTCLTGETWDGVHCMKTPPPPATTSGPCPPHSTWSGQVCIGPRGKAFCPGSMVMQNGSCISGTVGQTGPGATTGGGTVGPCPPLSTWNGLTCIGPRGKAFCPGSMVMQGRECVATTTPACPPRSTWNGAVCIGPNGNTFCPADMRMQGRVCVQ